MAFTIFQKLLQPIKCSITKNRFASSEESNLAKLSAPHKVDNWERHFLVWTKKYKSLDEVPAFVSQAVMEKTRNRMRIRIANYMIVATILGCCAMIYLGKQDAKAGKSVTKMNLEWHRQIKEEDEKAKAAAAQK
ncbi:unnamed protein product [Ceutorhynchus assimilis]|uniref:Uncharacterized protein n=1 Tax=Ceutorhynchus assimilis TaxID=467358 RepID=A0A9N9N0B5_9CUCU|nr:unnamed protein product [Ceutorhynchus assimilis]